MIKKIAVHAGILTAVFIIAVIVFSYLTNRGNTDMSADMGGAELPRISFRTEEGEVNSLPGYVTDMLLTSMRDTVTPVTNSRLELEVTAYDAEVKGLTWQVYTLDGETLLQEGEDAELQDGGTTLHFRAGDVLTAERVLKLTLHLAERDIYYYTRIEDTLDTHYEECLDFVGALHRAAVTGRDEELLSSALEPSGEGDNTTYQHVTIHSNYSQVTWGDLEPDVVGDVLWEVKECNETYTSVLLSYQVNLTGDTQSPEAMYEVKEFFRVRIVGDKRYLLDYDRTVERRFDGSRRPLDEKGLLLGIAPADLEYQSDPEGNVAVFVQDRELWHYDKKEDELSLVFSFADAESVDIRNLYDRHEIHIVSVAKNGDTVFTVCGYMNRGVHEGQTGVAVYQFDAEKNSVEERAFVPSRKGYSVMKEDLGRFVYFSSKNEKLYVMMGGTIYCVDLEADTREVLVRGLSEGQYTVSDDGRLVAYQNQGGKEDESQKITVLNLQTGESFERTSSGSEYIKPIGFIREDLAYGTLRAEDSGQNVAGRAVSPMYKVEIVSQKNEVIKTYQVDQIYILEGMVEENLMTLNRVTRNGTVYTPVLADYITNNEEQKETNVTLESYSDELLQTVRRLQFGDGISDTSAKLLKPKQVLFDRPMTVNFDEPGMGEKYYVYALGELQGSYGRAVYAIQKAEETRGVAVTAGQAYLWERGNLPKLYETEGFQPFTAAEGESTLAACLRQILVREGQDAAGALEELKEGGAPEQVLGRYTGGEGLDLTGCTVEEIEYILSRNTPVIALLGEDHAVLLIGYNETNVAYLDPADGQRYSVAISDLGSAVSAGGSVFVGYAK